MAITNTPYFGISKLYHAYMKKKKTTNLLTVALVVTLCSLSYFFGVWHHSLSPITTTLRAGFSCTPTNGSLTAGVRANSHLDFSTHHAGVVSDAGTETVRRSYPACDERYGEYTPCEDRDRSLKFERERLVYRERHCPEKRELLKCLVPAPYGYRSPFRWPESRDLAWYANVPHKELTVEKAVQNWIRVEGDQFRFPGGGTMFPRGADAYIDDIDRLMPLSDGSIRTAIDTGCGVPSLSLSFLYSL